MAVMYVLVAMAGVALALGPEPTVNGVRLLASGPYDWLRSIVPGLDGLRVPRRAIIIALLALTVLAAFGVRFLLDRLPRRPGRALALLLCGLVVGESENYRPVPLVAFDIPPSLQTANAWLRRRPPGAVLTLPAIGHRQGFDFDSDLRAMYGTLTHRHPVMNGATGFFPPLYWFFYYSGALESFDDYDYGDVLRGLRALGVRYVIVQTDPDLADSDKGRANLARHPPPAGSDCDNPRLQRSDRVRASAVGWRAAPRAPRNGPQCLVPGSPPQRRTARTS